MCALSFRLVQISMASSLQIVTEEIYRIIIKNARYNLLKTCHQCVLHRNKMTIDANLE